MNDPRWHVSSYDPADVIAQALGDIADAAAEGEGLDHRAMASYILRGLRAAYGTDHGRIPVPAPPQP